MRKNNNWNRALNFDRTSESQTLVTDEVHCRNIEIYLLRRRSEFLFLNKTKT